MEWVIESPFGPWVGLLVGALLLFAGRRLFWFLVAAVGFLVGWHLAGEWLGLEEPWLRIGVALLAGIAGGVLAVLLQKIAIGIAGFVLGGTAAAWFAANALGAGTGVQWAAFVIAGIVAAIVAGLLFEAALVVLSALLGASFVVQALPGAGVEMPRTWLPVVFLVLAAVGMAAQALGGRGRRRGETAPARRRRERD